MFTLKHVVIGFVGETTSLWRQVLRNLIREAYVRFAIHTSKNIKIKIRVSLQDLGQPLIKRTNFTRLGIVKKCLYKFTNGKPLEWQQVSLGKRPRRFGGRPRRRWSDNVSLGLGRRRIG